MLARPNYKKVDLLKPWSSGRPMNVLVFGDASNFTYRMTRFLLQQEHRVTLVEPIEFGHNVNYDKYKRFVQFQDDLRMSSYHDTISFLTATCAIGQPSDNPFSHIIVMAMELYRNNPDFLVETANCLTSVMEELKTLSPSPPLTLISDGIDDEQCDYCSQRSYQSIARNMVQSLLHLYCEVFNIPVRRLVISDVVNNHVDYSTFTSMLMSPMLTQAVCETVYLNPGSNTWSFLNTILTVFMKDEPAHISELEHESTLEVVLSTYFTLKKDPMRGDYKKTNRYSYISAWHKSLTRLGLKGVVFHDGLNASFTDSIKPKLYFEKVVLGKRSLNDDRYFHYLQYVEKHPHLTHILMTDIADVTFLRDPFELMRMFDHHLFFDEGILMNRIGSNNGICNVIDECFLNDTQLNRSIEWLHQLKPSYNAGVIGGPRHIVLRFLRILTALLDTLPVKANCNMAAVNYVVHKYFNDVIFTGFPFNSIFYQYEKNPRGVYVIHK